MDTPLENGGPSQHNRTPSDHTYNPANARSIGQSYFSNRANRPGKGPNTVQYRIKPQHSELASNNQPHPVEPTDQTPQLGNSIPLNNRKKKPKQTAGNPSGLNQSQLDSSAEIARFETPLQQPKKGPNKAQPGKAPRQNLSNERLLDSPGPIQPSPFPKKGPNQHAKPAQPNPFDLYSDLHSTLEAPLQPKKEQKQPQPGAQKKKKNNQQAQVPQPAFQIYSNPAELSQLAQPTQNKQKRQAQPTQRPPQTQHQQPTSPLPQGPNNTLGPKNAKHLPPTTNTNTPGPKNTKPSPPNNTPGPFPNRKNKNASNTPQSVSSTPGQPSQRGGNNRAQSNPQQRNSPGGLQASGKKARPRRPIFSEYLNLEKVVEGLAAGRLHEATFARSFNHKDGYCIVNGLPIDVYCEKTNQNRAFHGDTVAVLIFPTEKWVDMKEEAGLEEMEDSDIASLDDDEKEPKQLNFKEDPELTSSTVLIDPQAPEIPSSQILSQDPLQASPQELEPNLTSVPGQTDLQLPEIESSQSTLQDPPQVLSQELPELQVPTQGASAQEPTAASLGHPSKIPLPEIPEGKRPTGCVVYILKRPIVDMTLVGVLRPEYVSWPVDSGLPFGKLGDIIGVVGEIKAETAAILQANDIDTSEFPQSIVESLPKELHVTEEEAAKRKDLRGKRIFTIDPLTARDLDDAMHITALPNGNYEVGVHIADVSHYVQPRTSLDTAASNRATSVYMTQKVIPMLPRILCEELCSLNPNVDRLAFSIVWEMTAEGQVLSQWIGKSIIKSVAKLAYEHAQAVLDNYEEGLEGIKDLVAKGHDPTDVCKDIIALDSISAKLRKARFDSGALQLNGQPQLDFVLDENLLPISFCVHASKEANQLIEEFMLLANTCVAQFIYDHFPTQALLRKHPAPQQRKLNELVKLCEKMKVKMDVSSSRALHESLQALPAGIKELIEDRACSPMLPAAYVCTGDSHHEDFHHYALHKPLYTHFTSPIRRYADLAVHRLVQAALSNTMDQAETMERCMAIADNCNLKNQNSHNAQMNSQSLYLMVYLRDHPIDDDCVVYQFEKANFRIFSPALATSLRVNMSGYDIKLKGDIAFVSPRPKKAPNPNPQNNSEASPENASQPQDAPSEPPTLPPEYIPLQIPLLSRVKCRLTSVPPNRKAADLVATFVHEFTEK